MLNDSTTFLGLDLGDKHSHLVLLDLEGELIEETRMPTSKASFRRKFSGLPPAHVAMEVGTHSRWASHLLKELGHEVMVANARKLRMIYDNPRKGDRADAEILARLARLDPNLLSPIYHRSPQAQADLANIRSRDALVRSRTLLINHVRGIVKSSGARLPSCSAHSFSKKVEPSIPEPLRPALLPLLETTASGKTARSTIRSIHLPVVSRKRRWLPHSRNSLHHLLNTRDRRGNRLTSSSGQRLVRVTAGNNWVAGDRQRDGSTHLERTPTGTGLPEEPTKSADGSKAKGYSRSSIED